MKKYIKPTSQDINILNSEIIASSPDPDTINESGTDEEALSNTDFGWGFDDEDKSWKW